MDNKNHKVMYMLGLSSIVLALAFMISPNNYNNNAIAQPSSTMKPFSMRMSSPLQNQNWTGSISLASPILDMFKSKIHTTLNDATTSALNAVGGGSNSSAVAAFIHPDNGFLVYNILVLDSSNNIHRVIVDPGNGKVLSNQPMSMMEMMSMMHPSMGMGTMMMGPPNDMTMGQPSMGMMQHGMMGDGTQGMMEPSPNMMGHDMGMMGGDIQGGGAWP
ncbi:MAG TPA: PepSY domain-containing protein [Nitrososphaeraceae archaeon]|nr:PepSY domain-containing protein [Nitrososphaeraceae archaeon]